jgi:hypothetical protein
VQADESPASACLGHRALGRRGTLTAKPHAPVPRAPVRCAGESSVEQAEQRNGRQWKEFDIPHLVRLRGVQVYACELRVIAAVADELTVDGREMKPKVRKERRTF